MLFDQKKLDLVVKDCNGVSQPETDEKDISTEPQETAETEVNDQGYSGAQKPSLLISPALIFALVGGFVIVVIIAVLAFRARAK